MTTKQKWTDDRTEQLVNIVGPVGAEVTLDTVTQAAEALETTTRSISSKLRKMTYAVQSTVVAAVKSYSDTEETELRSLVELNPNTFTFGEIAAQLFSGTKSPKSIQGKLLSMELTSLVKPTEKVEVAKKYSEAEEATFISMASAGSSVEAIAEALGKTVQSVQGKSLSLSNSLEGFVRPVRESSNAVVKTDAFSELENIAELTVADIADSLDKSERGVKVMLTHRGVSCADYDGAKKAAKIAEKAAA